MLREIIVGSRSLVERMLSRLDTKQLHIWLPAYIRRVLSPRCKVPPGPVHLLVCIADHFEPALKRASSEQQTERVRQWIEKYPPIASRHRDGDGVPLQYTFFFPAEQYLPEHLEALAGLCRKGLGDVEIHLHHDGDVSESLRRQLVEFRQLLHDRHRLLHINSQTGAVEYGFIHGNWALGNSAAGGRFCGVNDELTVLRETGCYADFTLPSAPSETQTWKINSIYYATGNPLRPKPHNTGQDVEAGRLAPESLMIIQGPLALNWRSRKWGILPRIESGELSADNPPTCDRVDLWVQQHIHVKGRPEWVFVKLFSHGANDINRQTLLGEPMERMLSYLETSYNDGTNYCLHYVTARQMYNIIKAAEAGAGDNPHLFREYGTVAAGNLLRTNRENP